MLGFFDVEIHDQISKSKDLNIKKISKPQHQKIENQKIPN